MSTATSRKRGADGSMMYAATSVLTGTDPCKVWLTGFPRKLMADQLKEAANEALTIIPEATAKQVIVKPLNLRVVCPTHLPVTSIKRRLHFSRQEQTVVVDRPSARSEIPRD